MKNKLMCAVLAACLLTSLLAAPVYASEAGEMTDPAAVLTEEGGTETVEETAGVETEEEQDAEDIEEAGEEIPPEEDVQEETVTDVPEVTETPEESTQTPAAQPPKKTSTKAEQEPEDVEEADPEEELREAAYADITYQVHQQTFGWLPWVANGEEAGVTGLSKRMEAILIELEDQTVDGSVEYRTHVQTYGWQNWVRDGQMAGTSGEAKRLEAIQIRLTGQMAQEFDIWYRVHCQTFGWMGWAKNGAQAGSAGYAKRLEAIEIRLVEKGGPAPGSTANAFRSAEKDAAGAGTAGTGIEYRTHVQTYGWLDYVRNGEASGTTGEAKRLEGINIRLTDPETTGSVQYRTHVQTYGWQDWVKDDAMAGTTGEAKRLEAIQIKLTGNLAKKYDIYYRVHCQTFGWMGWAKNGAQAGSAGYAKRLEAIEIRLVTKGGNAPGSTAGAFKEYKAPANDSSRMNEANWQVLINVIGAVESGGQIYGNRNYASYAGRYHASPFEYTCTLGWAQFYGAEAQNLIQHIYDADPAAFRKIDSKGIIRKMLGKDWVGMRWDPNSTEKALLIKLITSPVGKQQQDLLFRSQCAPFVADCEYLYTTSAKAVIMYCEIRHLGGQAAADRIFQRCSGNYSTSHILAVLKWDQYDHSSYYQVGDAIYDRRHAKCAEFVEQYVQ